MIYFFIFTFNKNHFVSYNSVQFTVQRKEGRKKYNKKYNNDYCPLAKALLQLHFALFGADLVDVA